MRKSLKKQSSFWMVLAAALLLLACHPAVSKKRVVPPAEVRPALDAAPDQLVAQYRQQASAVHSLNAAVEMVPLAGSTYSGVIEEYHEIDGFVLADKPTHIRVIGQAPVVAKNVFDMVSDGVTFHIFIPPKNKFIVGPATFEHPSKKSIENLRPQHLLDALFWQDIASENPVLFEEFNADPARYYILTVLRGPAALEIERKLWFDRSDLRLARVQRYAPGGRLISETRYADWQPVQLASASARAEVEYPRHIWLTRPHDDYQLEMRITRLALNEAIAADRFRLEQPPGTELVRVGEGDAGAQP